MKLRTEFQLNRSKKDGLQTRCRPCQNFTMGGTVEGKANMLRAQYGYDWEGSFVVARRLYDDEERCEICGIPNWLIQKHYRDGYKIPRVRGPAGARMHHDRIDCSRPHGIDNYRLLCPSCNVLRGDEKKTDVEILREVSAWWHWVYNGRFLFWLNTEPGKGGRAHLNPKRKERYQNEPSLREGGCPLPGGHALPVSGASEDDGVVLAHAQPSGYRQG